jgi:spore maturation protein CgeB
MRTFEAAAAAAFQLTEYKQDLQELFDLDRELVCFRSEEELRDLIPRYLRAESERREKAEAARERVWARHTFTHRLSTLLRQLS